MENNIQKCGEFSVALVGTPQKYNEVLSKGRCRIFYKGLNRNGGYITDEFAEKLLASLPYTPVKGIYDDAEGDYTDHGAVRRAGRVYGIVPENPNVVWELHRDDDGVERAYATTDVLLFTAIYEEAIEALSKGQSMELYYPSIKGNWETRDNEYCYVYTDGCFLGLQILGDNTEPCFEGAAFYSLQESFKELMKELEKYDLVPKGGKNKMEYVFNFEGFEKFSAIWNLLNHETNEEGKLLVSYSICKIGEEDALVMNHSNGNFEKVQYTTDEEGNYLLGEFSTCSMFEVSEEENNSLCALKEMNNGTFANVEVEFNARAESINELNTKVSEFEQKVSEFEQKKVEDETAISTLTVEKEEALTQCAAAQASLDEKISEINALNEQLEALKAYKKSVEDAAKAEVIESYSVKLSKDVLAQFSARMDEYATVVDLDKDLAYEVKKANPNLFAAEDRTPTFIKDINMESGLEAILSKYKK